MIFKYNYKCKRFEDRNGKRKKVTHTDITRKKWYDDKMLKNQMI